MSTLAKIAVAVLLVGLAVACWYLTNRETASSRVPPLFRFTFEGGLLKWHNQPITCPHCKTRLQERPRLDRFSHGIVCENGHRFFLKTKTVLAANSIVRNKFILPTTLKEPLAITQYWLTDENARSHLNDQLAEILVRIHEIETRGVNIPDRPSFHYCPFCQQSLSDRGSEDGWVIDLYCSNNHRWGSRGGSLRGIFNNERVELSTEMTDTVLETMIDAWLDNPRQATNLHSSVEHVLRGFVQRPER